MIKRLLKLIRICYFLKIIRDLAHNLPTRNGIYTAIYLEFNCSIKFI